MAAILQDVDHGDAEQFETTLEKFRQTTVDQENYPEFVQQVDSTIAQIDQIIGSLQDDRADAKAEKQRVKDAMGADLQPIREDGLDHKKLGETGAEGDIRRINHKLEVWFSFRAELERVKAAKLEDVLDEVDSREVWNRTWEKLEEMVDGRIEDVEQRQKEFEQEIREDLQEHRRQVQERNKDWYELQKERWDRREERVRDLLTRGLDILESLGANVHDLREQLELVAEDELTVPSADGADDRLFVAPEYEFAEKPVAEQFDVLQELLADEPVEDLSKDEIVERIDVDREAFFDPENGILAEVEEFSGDNYPELRDAEAEAGA